MKSSVLGHFQVIQLTFAIYADTMISMIQLPSNVFSEQKLFIQGNINSGHLLHDLIFVALPQQVSGGQPQVHLQLEAIGSRRLPFQLGLPWFALLRNFCGRWLIGFWAKVVAPTANVKIFFTVITDLFNKLLKWMERWLPKTTRH